MLVVCWPSDRMVMTGLVGFVDSILLLVVGGDLLYGGVEVVVVVVVGTRLEIAATVSLVLGLRSE